MTDGIRVYRHRGHYIINAVLNSAGPCDFGYWLCSTIPCGRDDNQFEVWLARQRLLCDQNIANDTVHPFDGDMESGRFGPAGWAFQIGEERPFRYGNNTYKFPDPCSWIYEIDLDNLVLHVNNTPLFRLDCMPPAEEFDQYVECDHYDHISYSLQTPEEYRFDTERRRPVADSLLVDEYGQLPCSSMSIHQLLEFPENMSDKELVRLAMLEISIGALMRAHKSGIALRMLKLAINRDAISDYTFALALSILDIAVSPMIYIPPSFCKDDQESKFNGDFVWLRANICIRICTHLVDDQNMQAVIAEIVRFVRHPSQAIKQVAFGIAFSVFHCVIIRFGTDGSIAHTPVLQFLPSFFALTPSTDGITAISRLCYLPDPDIAVKLFPLHDFVRRSSQPFTAFPAVNTMVWKVPLLPAGHILARVPNEIWQMIAKNLNITCDLLAFSLITRCTLNIGADICANPRISNYMLIKLAEERDSMGRRAEIDLDALSDEESDEESDVDVKFSEGVFNNLCRATFVTINKDGEARWLFVGPFEETRTWRTHLSFHATGNFVMRLLVTPSPSSRFYPTSHGIPIPYVELK